MSTFNRLCTDGVKLAATYPGPQGEPMPFWDSVLAHAGEQLVGRPQDVLEELHTGTAFAPGSYTRQAMFPVAPRKPGQSILGNLGRYAMPALYYGPGLYSLYSAMSEPESARGTAVGDAVGNLIGTAAGSPFGYLGSMVGSMLGSNLGRGVGHVFDRLPPQRPFPRNFELDQVGSAESPYYADRVLRQ